MGKPNYYSILPADVRYDIELGDKAKLLFSEITSLANATGECYASNEYFQKLYSLSESTIHRIIKQLKNKGYIEIDYVYKHNTKEIKKRIIKVVSNLTPGGVRNDGDNNKKKYNNTKVLLYKKDEPTLTEIKEYADKRKLTHVDCEYFYNYFNDSNWVDSKGRKVRSWKQKILTWEKMEKKKGEKSESNIEYERL